ncbi:RNase H family protein [Streptomyces sp. NPDC004533]|uniref:RNase H family protein n=1 Tax=Streptomyces sp. NPDC004533 TaxID=3154278 RepID=UPI0033BAF00D
MTIPARHELVSRLAEDFTALQDAALARMNGTASPQTEAALEHPALAGGVAIALAHTEVLARGAVRRAELSVMPAQRVRPLREYARRVRRARSQAEAVCKEQRARRISRGRMPVTVPLDLRVARAAHPQAYLRAVEEELTHRGLPADALSVPNYERARWAQERQLIHTEIASAVRELLDCGDDFFVQALLHDARQAENPHLGHDAIVERWNRQAPTALAWGRYAIAQAERAALARPLTARSVQLDALEDAYQDTAILTARAVEARHKTADLHDRIRELTSTGSFADLIAQCHAGAIARFAAVHRGLWDRARLLAAEHQASCLQRVEGCPRCHLALAAALALEVPGTASLDEDDAPGEIVEPDAASDRYAILNDLLPHAVVAVADAAVGDESAQCGYAWVCENGTTGHGASMAHSSGEAEVIGICNAALNLLDHSPGSPIVILCDSSEAVTTVNRALETADPAVAHRTVVFPEGRQLLANLMPYRDRVEVRWLKGHIGHDLNETADALAAVALRRATGRIPAAVARKEQAHILRTLRFAQGEPPTAA